MNSNEEFELGDDLGSTLTVPQEDDLDVTPEPDDDGEEGGEATITIDGKEYTMEEAKRLVSLGSDYTQKRQAEAEELREIRAQIEALSTTGNADDAPAFDSPAAWLQSQLGDEMDATAEGIALANGMAEVAGEITALRAEIEALKAEQAPIRAQREQAQAMNQVAVLCKESGVEANGAAIAAALKAAGGNVAKAYAQVVKGAIAKPNEARRKTPASPGVGGKSLVDIPDEELTEEQRDQKFAAQLREMQRG